MNEANFVKRLNWIATGDSFLKEQSIPLSVITNPTTFQAVSAGIAIAPVAAACIMTITDQPDDLDEIRIGPYTYTFDETTLVDVPFHVLIAGTASLTLDNLLAAVNNTGTEGTDYGTLTPQNPAVSAGSKDATHITFTARVAGEQGNSIGVAGVGGPGNDGLSGQSWSECTFASDALTGGAGSPVATSVRPAVVKAGLSFADGETALITFQLPMDYDETSDRLILKFFVQPDSTASDIGILTAQDRWRAGVVLAGTTPGAKAETSTTSGGLAREVFLSIGGDSMHAGDVIQRTIDVNATTNPLVLLAASFIYGSTLAAYNSNDRHRDAAFTTGDQ